MIKSSSQRQPCPLHVSTILALISAHRSVVLHQHHRPSIRTRIRLTAIGGVNAITHQVALVSIRTPMLFRSRCLAVVCLTSLSLSLSLCLPRCVLLPNDARVSVQNSSMNLGCQMDISMSNWGNYGQAVVDEAKLLSSLSIL